VAQAQSMLGPEFGKRAVRFALTVVGLLILRTVLAVLPMLSKASAIGDSLVSPLVIANTVVDTMIILALLRFGLSMGRSIRESYVRFPDLGNIVSLAFVVIVLILAYKQYETLTACLVISPSDFTKMGQTGTLENLDQFQKGLGNVFGAIANAQVKMATGDTLVAFQRVAVALLRQPPDLYGWTFLVLIAVPVVGIVVLVWRNMDTITSLVMQSGSALAGAPSVGAAIQCGSCGQPIAVGVKFCPNCGAASVVPTVSAKSVCPSCGAQNPGSARFCKECGHSV
jgi:ribosomal protein L40E